MARISGVSEGAPIRSDDELGLDATEPSPPTGRRALVTAKKATVIAYVTGMFLGAMDNHIVNVALPTLSREFHSSVAAVQWTVIAYVLALALWIPASGWIGDRVGTKRTFLLALAIFTIASMLCGQARNLPELIAARALQGTGGGMITPVAMSMLWRAHPPSERARLARLMILPILVAPAIAPVVGGLLIEDLSWRWIFYVNVPFGIAAVIFCAKYLEEHVERAESRFDMPGFLLSGGGLILVLYAISEGSYLGWGSPAIIITGVAGIAVLATFVRVELAHREDPILRLSLLSERLFRAGNVVTMLQTASFLGILYLCPIYLQEALHQSPLRSGLTTFVEAIGVVAGTQTIGRLYPKIGPRRLASSGLLALTVIIFAISRTDATTNLWQIRGLLFVAGAASSTAFLPMQTSMFTNIAPTDTGHASAIFNAYRQASLAFGVAIISTVVAANGSGAMAFRAGFVTAAILSLAGAVASFFLIHDVDAAPTMSRTPAERRALLRRSRASTG